MMGIRKRNMEGRERGSGAKEKIKLQFFFSRSNPSSAPDYGAGEDAIK